MKRAFVSVTSLAFAALSFAQMNMKDSTVQVIGYWDRNEKQSYTVSHEEYKVAKGDTLDRNILKYDVGITIIDSTAGSYTIEWDYSNLVVQSASPMLKKLMKATMLTKAVIKTTECGAFVELLNWKDVRTESIRSIRMLGYELKGTPNLDQILKQQMAKYETKESIQNALIDEIKQFYAFHGGVYKYGSDVVSTIQVPNKYGGNPFDAKVTIWVDTLDEKHSYSTLCMTNTVDSVQLWNAAYDYLSKSASTLAVSLPKKEDFPSFTNVTYTTAQIHNLGWVIYSIVTKEVEADHVLKVEEQIIELK